MSFHIMCVIHLLVVLSLMNDFVPIRAANLKSPQTANEDLLEQFIGDSLEGIDDNGSFEDHLADKVDTVANMLNIVSDHSEDLTDAIAKAVNVYELLEEDADQDVTTRPTMDKISRRPGLLGLLDAEEPNPHIAHARRSVNLEKFVDKTQNFLNILPRHEREFLKQVAQEVVSLEDNGKELDFDDIKTMTDAAPKEPQIRGMMRLAVSVWQRGVDVLDRFYQSPEFIMKVPVLSDYLRTLKKKGEPIYNLVDFLRHSVYLLKFMPFHPERIDPTKASDVDRRRLERAKTMISDAGATALKSLAFKIIAKYAHKVVTEEATQEFVSRTLYYILGMMLIGEKK